MQTTLSLADEARAFLTDADARRDPYGLYRRLLADEPLLNPVPRTWFVARWDDVTDVLADARFSLDPNAVEPPLRLAQSPAVHDALAAMLSFRDGADHARLRRLAARAFTPRAVAALAETVEATVDELLAPAFERGSLELIAEVGDPLPVAVSCAMFAIPRADREQVLAWVTQLRDQISRFAQPAAEVARAESALRDFTAYVESLRAERAARPGDDLLSELAAVAEGGDRLTDVELVSFFVLLLMNGLETVTNALGNALWTLLEHPDELARLRDEPSLLASAWEECLRYTTPARLAARRAVENVELHGRVVPRGDVVLTLFAAANRDPQRFDEPDRFDVARDPNRHLGFGHGPHYCLGGALGSLQGRVVLDRLVRRTRGLELAGDPIWKDSLPFLGLESLPVRFEVAR